MAKETFCAALRQILEQREVDEKITAALELVGHYVFGCKNRCLDAPTVERSGVLICIFKTTKNLANWTKTPMLR